MVAPKTLHGRLALWYAAVLAVTLVAFAARHLLRRSPTRTRRTSASRPTCARSSTRRSTSGGASASPSAWRCRARSPSPSSAGSGSRAATCARSTTSRAWPASSAARRSTGACRSRPTPPSSSPQLGDALNQMLGAHRSLGARHAPLHRRRLARAAHAAGRAARRARGHAAPPAHRATSCAEPARARSKRSERLSELVELLLTLARSDAGELPVRRAPSTPASWWRAWPRRTRRSRAQRGVALELERRAARSSCRRIRPGSSAPSSTSSTTPASSPATGGRVDVETFAARRQRAHRRRRQRPRPRRRRGRAPVRALLSRHARPRHARLRPRAGARARRRARARRPPRRRPEPPRRRPPSRSCYRTARRVLPAQQPAARTPAPRRSNSPRRQCDHCSIPPLAGAGCGTRAAGQVCARPLYLPRAVLRTDHDRCGVGRYERAVDVRKERPHRACGNWRRVGGRASRGSATSAPRLEEHAAGGGDCDGFTRRQGPHARCGRGVCAGTIRRSFEPYAKP